MARLMDMPLSVDMYIAVQPLDADRIRELRRSICTQVRTRWPPKRLCADALDLVFAFAGMSTGQFVICPAGRGLYVRMEVTSFKNHFVTPVSIPIPGVGELVDSALQTGGPPVPCCKLLQPSLGRFIGGRWGRDYVLTNIARNAGVLDEFPLHRADRESPAVRFTLLFKVDIAVDSSARHATPLSLPIPAERVVRFEERCKTGCWVKCTQPPRVRPDPRVEYVDIPDVMAWIRNERLEGLTCETPPAKRARRVSDAE